jgi:predicted aspartyl protease
MIAGRFGENGELFFEIEFLAVDGERFSTEALLDTGFTTGWLAINSQDLEALQWSLIASQIEMQTARGDEYFDLYEGKVLLDGREFLIPVHVGDEIPDILLGTQWLEIVEIVVNKRKGVLTLEILEPEK